MRVDELDFEYPEHLVATERAPRSRVLWAEGSAAPVELSVPELLEKFAAGDLLVVNDTKVLRRRVFSEAGLEILFLNPLDEAQKRWKVLCPASRWKKNTEQTLPGGVQLKLIERGIPQTVEADRSLDSEYFESSGELPLPPYIQKARGERRNRGADRDEYQTAWAEAPGSLAAPTASLHFTDDDLRVLEARGVRIAKLTLHVGLGTFLPISVDDLDQHVMHSESVAISKETWMAVEATRARGGKVWALGTTVTRSLEAAARGKLLALAEGGFMGETDLFIRPGTTPETASMGEFKVVDRLLTNFHQPRSTLVALVGAFAGLERVREVYAWAIEKEFRLFSYGDLTAWSK